MLVIPTDVSKLDQVVKLRDKVYETWGEVRNLLFYFVPFYFLGSLANLRFRREPQCGGYLHCDVIHMFSCFRIFSLGPCPCRYLKRLLSFHFTLPSFHHTPFGPYPHLIRDVSLLCIQVAVLMNNAGIGNKGTSWEGIDNWHEVFEVNVFG